MKPRPLPKRYEDVWQKQSWPTFDELRAQNPDIKVHVLRAALEKVPCYRCPDKSARYEPTRAQEALLGAKLEDSPPPPPRNDNSRARPKSTRDEDDDEDEDDEEDEDEAALHDNRVDGLVLFKQSLLISNELRKGMGDLATSMAKAIDQMTAPMKLALELVESQTKRMADRLQHHEKVQDRMQLAMEGLLTEQATRELMAIREKNAQQMRQKTFDLAAGYVPGLVKQFKPTQLGNAALRALETLEPEVFDAIAGSADMTDAQKEAWAVAANLFRAHRESQRHANQQEPPQQNPPPPPAEPAAA